MSTQVAESQLPCQHPPSTRTRLQPIGGHGKSIYVMLICLVLSIACALGAHSYSNGGAVHINHNASNARVFIDGSSTTLLVSPNDYRGVPFGTRTIQIVHEDFEPVTRSVHVGWLSENSFTFQLKPMVTILFVNTTPFAAIALDGQEAGTANNQGVFVRAGINAGMHTVGISLPGYSRFAGQVHLAAPRAFVSYWLPMIIRR
jgi:hypothetical protein